MAHLFIPSKPLSSLQTGQFAVISSLHLPENVRAHIQAMGLVPGTSVQCLRKKQKSLSAYEVRGAVIAIRERDAALILCRSLTTT